MFIDIVVGGASLAICVAYVYLQVAKLGAVLNATDFEQGRFASEVFGAVLRSATMVTVLAFFNYALFLRSAELAFWTLCATPVAAVCVALLTRGLPR